jgi:hypothetical protein
MEDDVRPPKRSRGRLRLVSAREMTPSKDEGAAQVDTTRIHCFRCRHEVDVVGVWPGYRWAKRAWYSAIGLLCVLSPIILSELTVLIPLAVCIAMAAGPVHSLAAQKPTCRDCGAELP